MFQSQLGCKHHQQQGFSLIEVLVALVIISVGLVGLIMTQGYHQQQAFAAHQRTLAGIHAQDLQNQLRMQVCYLPQIETDSKWLEFLNAQKSDWVKDHALLQRAGWDIKFDAQPKDDNYEEAFKTAEADGYWTFNLDVTAAAPLSHLSTVINQRLLVEFQEGCQ